MSKKVGIYVEQVECVTYTLAKSFSLGGYNTYIITDIELAQTNSQHRIYLDKVRNTSNVTVLNIQHPGSQNLDLLCVELLPSHNRGLLSGWTKRTKQIVAVSYVTGTSGQRRLFEQTKEFVKYLPFSLWFKNIGFLNLTDKFNLYQLYTRSYILGFDVHSKFLQDDKLSAQMFSFDWLPQAARKYKMNFLGNLLPDQRTKILVEVKEYLGISKQPPVGELCLPNFNERVMWFEYDHSLPVADRGLSAEEYIDCLSESDFTLCPPGYSKVTHRVIEALVRGSIPVLNEDELALYDIELNDGENCIAVSKGDWISGINRILTLSYPQLIEMRYNIMAMKEKYLLPETNARRLRYKMGLM